MIPFFVYNFLLFYLTLHTHVVFRGSYSLDLRSLGFGEITTFRFLLNGEVNVVLLGYTNPSLI